MHSFNPALLQHVATVSLDLMGGKWKAQYRLRPKTDPLRLANVKAGEPSRAFIRGASGPIMPLTACIMVVVSHNKHV